MDISHKIVRTLLQLGGVLYKTGNRITEPFGLNQQQFILLNEIVEKESISQKELVAELLLEKSNVSKMVKKLHRKELISISKSPYDMRTTLLESTEKGKHVRSECMNNLNTWNKGCFGELDREDAESALAILENLHRLMLDQNQRKR